MAYDVEKYVRLKALQALAQRAKASDDALAAKLEEIKAGVGAARFEVADAAPTAETAQDGVLYLVKNASGSYDIYVKAGDQVVKTGDTTVDLTGYVQKEEGKGLSTNDFTNAEKAKLAAIDAATDAEVKEMLDGVFGAEA